MLSIHVCDKILDNVLCVDKLKIIFCGIFRDRKKAAKASEKTVDSATSSKPRKTRHAITTQRTKWKLEKQKQRQNWSAQKRRRHKERCAKYYDQHHRKDKVLQSKFKIYLHHLSPPLSSMLTDDAVFSEPMIILPFILM